MTSPGEPTATTTAAADQSMVRPSLLVRFMNLVSHLCLYLAGTAITLIVIINAVNVFCRYVLFWALSWAEEAMVFLMINAVFAGTITVTWEQIHIRIDALVQRLGRVPRLIAEWLSIGITAAVLFPLAQVSLRVVSKLYEFDQRSDALHLPVWIPQATVPFALVSIPIVMAIVLLSRGIEVNRTH